MSSSLPSRLAALALTAAASLGAQAHVSLEEPQALAGGSYKAVLRIGHGCEGTATHTLSVRVPAGFRGAKPMPKTGWSLSIERAAPAQPGAAWFQVRQQCEWNWAEIPASGTSTKGLKSPAVLLDVVPDHSGHAAH